jgi:hypothetical protein
LESATLKEALALMLQQREALEAKLEAAKDEKLDEPPIEGRLKSLESGTV